MKKVLSAVIALSFLAAIGYAFTSEMSVAEAASWHNYKCAKCGWTSSKYGNDKPCPYGCGGDPLVYHDWRIIN